MGSSIVVSSRTSGALARVAFASTGTSRTSKAFSFWSHAVEFLFLPDHRVDSREPEFSFYFSHLYNHLRSVAQAARPSCRRDSGIAAVQTSACIDASVHPVG